MTGDAQLEAVRRLILGDSPDGYEAFYTLMRQATAPYHVVKFVDKIYEAHARGRGVVTYAWRGSTKTTAITQIFGTYRIALNPSSDHLLIQVTDASAVDNAAVMAGWIKNSQTFNSLFPTIIPDEPAGWGASGYEIYDKSVNYGAWKEMRTAHPSLLALGYKSGEILGKHPRGWLLVDDINNEQNTRSRKERVYVNQIVKGTIFPTITDTTWSLFVGTPWIEDDVLDYVAKTGEFDVVKLPVCDSPSDAPEADKVWLECMKKYYHLNWPERFTAKEINKQFKLAGSDFPRMFLLDTTLMKGRRLQREWLKPFDASKIEANWPVVMGVDYGSSVDRQEDIDDLDYTAIVKGRIMPMNGGILIETGWRDRMSQLQAETKIKTLGTAFRPLLRAVGHESVAGTAGHELCTLLLNTSSLPIIPVKHTGKAHSGGKGYRFEKLMAPHFEAGRIWISDAEDEFLAEFMKEWVGYPDEPHDDTLDAVYCMLWVALGALLPFDGEYGDFEDEEPEKELDNPFIGIGRHHG